MIQFDVHFPHVCKFNYEFCISNLSLLCVVFFMLGIQFSQLLACFN